MSRVNCFCMSLLVAVVTLTATASAIPIRQSSDNGQSGDEDFWTLIGRTVPFTLSANGISVKMTRQIICPQQDRQDGGCASGQYMFLFQIQSSSTNIPIKISRLQGFTQGGGNNPYNYGVMICDDANNDLELCTEDPNDPNYQNLAGITFKQNSKTSVTFTVPSVYNFPQGSQPEEGQGLTFFIVTQQNAALPIAYPAIGD